MSNLVITFLTIAAVAVVALAFTLWIYALLTVISDEPPLTRAIWGKPRIEEIEEGGE